MFCGGGPTDRSRYFLPVWRGPRKISKVRNNCNSKQRGLVLAEEYTVISLLRHRITHQVRICLDLLGAAHFQARYSVDSSSSLSGFDQVGNRESAYSIGQLCPHRWVDYSGKGALGDDRNSAGCYGGVRYALCDVPAFRCLVTFRTTRSLESSVYNEFK